MTELVGHDVGGSKVALGAELILELVEEAEVEVDLLVNRAVVRPDCLVGSTAPGVGEPLEEDQPRCPVVVPARLGEDLGPHQVEVDVHGVHVLPGLGVGIGGGVEGAATLPPAHSGRQRAW